MKRVRGFTLIELVIVLALLAILAAVAVPRFVNLADRARVATAKAELGALRAAAQLFYASAAVAGTPDFPSSRALLTAELDSPLTQACNRASCATFAWSYSASTGSIQMSPEDGSSGGWEW